jgi:hypothetical protein
LSIKSSDTNVLVSEGALGLKSSNKATPHAEIISPKKIKLRHTISSPQSQSKSSLQAKSSQLDIVKTENILKEAKQPKTHMTSKNERLSLPKNAKNSIECACCGDAFIDFTDLPEIAKDYSKIDRTLTDLTRTDSKAETRLLTVQRQTLETQAQQILDEFGRTLSKFGTSHNAYQS